MGAALCGRTALVRHLIDARADLDMQDSEGATALMCAALSSHHQGRETGIHQMLVSAGADTAIRSAAGETVQEMTERLLREEAENREAYGCSA